MFLGDLVEGIQDAYRGDFYRCHFQFDEMSSMTIAGISDVFPDTGSSTVMLMQARTSIGPMIRGIPRGRGAAAQCAENNHGKSECFNSNEGHEEDLHDLQIHGKSEGFLRRIVSSITHMR